MKPKLKTKCLLFRSLYDSHMKKKIIQIKYFLIVLRHFLKIHWNKYRFKYFIIFFCGMIIYSKDIHFEFELKSHHLNISKNESSTKNEIDTTRFFKKPVSGIIGKNGNINLVSSPDESPREKKYKNYINRHYRLAVEEMHRHKIPASITLAQGLLETNGGQSSLAVKNKNHFGIKCFSKKCKKGHCSNFNDDSHKDFFRIYSSTADSYHAHSLFLKKERYKKLFLLNEKDYKSWAKELKNAGYATDKNYANKLIALIQKYRLHEFDDL